MFSDLKFALRQFKKAAGFSTVCVVTLAIGIGACTAIFSVINSVLLQPIGVLEPERLVAVHESFLPRFPTFAVSAASFRQWQTLAGDVFDGLYAQRTTSFTIIGNDAPQRISALRVSGGFFSTVGVSATIGRVFGPEDDEPGKDRVVVLSYEFWQNQFGGRADIVGQEMRLDDQPYTILGVLPATFPQTMVRNVVVPLALTQTQLEDRGAHFLTVFGRLKKGISIEQAQVKLSTIAAQLAAQFPDTNATWGVVVRSYTKEQTGGISGTLYILLAAVGVLLLIACGNVANLLMARATSRQRDVCIQRALGATYWHVMRRLLVESTLFSFFGAALGVLLAKWGLNVILALAPYNLLRRQVTLDGYAVAVAVGLAVITAIVFGLLPALQSRRVALVDALKEGSRGASGSPRHHLARRALVVTQIAMALMLLMGAGLLIRSFAKLTSFDPGFQLDGAVHVVIDLPGQKYDTPEKRAAFVSSLLERYRTMPGVTAAGVTQVLPMAGADVVLGFEIEGREAAPNEACITNYCAVTPDYFKAAGIRLVRGRGISDEDKAGATPVMVISQALAERYFPGEDPIGRRISVSNGPRQWRQIVGVVSEVKLYGFERDTEPQTYASFAQSPVGNFSVVVRTNLDPKSMIPSIRRAVLDVDPKQPISRTEPLANLLATAIVRNRFVMALSTVFSVLALLLATVGVYSVMAYGVAQRTSEFGIRMALGAQRAEIFRMVVGQATRVISLGVALGVMGVFGVSRFISTLLYQTPTNDPLVFGGTALVVSIVGLLASVVPAYRATQVDPTVALRVD